MDRRAPVICACGDHAFVGLTRAMVALISPQDLSCVAERLWCAEIKGLRAYALRGIGPRRARTRIYMHRLILSEVNGKDIDHVNGDGTDNRRQNLRFANRWQNNANQRPRKGVSRFKGVHLHKATGKWCAQIRHGTDRRHLGLFDTQEMAARAYDDAAIDLFGEHARTNEDLGLLEAIK